MKLKFSRWVGGKICSVIKMNLADDQVCMKFAKKSKISAEIARLKF